MNLNGSLNNLFNISKLQSMKSLQKSCLPCLTAMNKWQEMKGVSENGNCLYFQA